MKPIAVLFDFDGVLVDSLELHLRAWRDASIELFGNDIDDPDRLGGMASKVIASQVAKENGKPDLSQRLFTRKQELLIENKTPVPLLTGTRQAFEKLDELMIPFGVASNTPRAFLENSFKNCGLNSPRAIVGIDEVENPKPAPDPFIMCAERLGIPERDFGSVLVFEDSRHGLTAALNANMYAIGVASRHSHDELISWGAKKSCDHLQDAIEKGFFTSFR